jgi:hypothetical protein
VGADDDRRAVDVLGAPLDHAAKRSRPGPAPLAPPCRPRLRRLTAVFLRISSAAPGLSTGIEATSSSGSAFRAHAC